MIRIEAKIPARTMTSNQTGKEFSFPARVDIYEQGETGQWTIEEAWGVDRVTEDEVIDVCQRATNWAEIKAEHFPMHGFHS